MLRFIAPALTLLLIAPLCANAASKQDYELNKELEKVAASSNVGKPNAISEDILDEGYTVDGRMLINHLSVQSGQAAQMRENPDLVGRQLGTSVCRNTGYRQLMGKGAILRYEFKEYKTGKLITTQQITAADCAAKAPAKKK
ncbi:PA3611 family quorum-sensing-regulated virulence factor [Pseudomonas sp. NPDC087358]|uniref:PA3611 family quorum-sensing-regulated virulence factor n=1 Tax=Pseudomonas sp. NPDC087358 TaxID=3364439 RepID=UPI00384E926B